MGGWHCGLGGRPTIEGGAAGHGSDDEEEEGDGDGEEAGSAEEEEDEEGTSEMGARLVA